MGRKKSDPLWQAEEAMPMRALLFDADGNDTELPPTPGALKPAGERQLLWVDLEGEAPQELPGVLAAVGLPPDTLTRLQLLNRPDLLQHEDHVGLRMQAACDRGKSVTVMVLAGRNFVLTVHPEAIKPLEEFRTQVKGDTQLGKLDSAAFMAVLLTRILETYFGVVAQIEQLTDQLDESLLRPGGQREPLQELVTLRRQIGELRRELSAHRPLFLHLSSPDFVVYAGDEHESQFSSLNLHFEHALDSVAHSRDLVLGSFDLYMSSQSQRTNDIMRILTVVTILLGLLSAVAGFMGMNFQADIFKTGNTGFRDVLIVSALLIALVLLGSWRRKWL